MRFTSYAQNYEDVLLWRALHHVENGRYLDIGAQDPVQDSVSLAFYNAGWRGIHVEPTPTYAARLREARPDETVIEAAVSHTPGPIEFHEFPETGLSTGQSDIAVGHEAQGLAGRKILVPTVRLADLLERTGDLHWMKIDVEGMEADVLESWGDHPARPWVLVIEATVPNTQEATDHLWRSFVLTRGYHEVHFDGLSRYFVSENQPGLERAFGSPPNIFDNFNVDYHHFTAKDLVRTFEERLRESRAELLIKEEALGAQAQQLEAAVVAERAHRETAERFERERRELESQLRQQLQKSASEMLVAVEELATLRERTTHLFSETQRLTQELQDVKEAKRAEASAFQQQLEERVRQADEAVARASALEKRLAEAESLVLKALAEPNGRWQLLGRALGLAGEDGTRRVLRSWHAHSHSAVHQTDAAMHFAPSGEARNPYIRADSLAELLSWHDVNFVRCAYVTVLGRQPEPAGESYYADRIRQGHSKLEVLWQLRRSSEARRHDPGIAGFDRALKRAAWARKPVIGAVVRLFVKSEADDRLARMHRAISNDLAVMKEALGVQPNTTGPTRPAAPNHPSDDAPAIPKDLVESVSQRLSEPSRESFQILVGV